MEYIRALEVRMIRRYSHMKDSRGYNGCLSKAIVPSEEGRRKGIEKYKKRCKEKPITRSKETREKISKALIGIKHTEERKKNISEAVKGRILSDEHKENISISVSGERNGFYDKTHSPEVRAGISKNRKAYYDKIGRKAKKEVKREKSAGENNPMFGQGEKLAGEKHPRYQLWNIDGVEMPTKEALDFLGISLYKMKQRYTSRFPNAYKYQQRKCNERKLFDY